MCLSTKLTHQSSRVSGGAETVVVYLKIVPPHHSYRLTPHANYQRGAKGRTTKRSTAVERKSLQRNKFTHTTNCHNTSAHFYHSCALPNPCNKCLNTEHQTIPPLYPKQELIGSIHHLAFMSYLEDIFTS